MSSCTFSLSDTLRHVEIESTLKHAGLEVFFLRWPVVSRLDYWTIDEALGAESVEITEMTDVSRVSRLQIANRSSRMVFLMAGEQFVGGKQNRVSNVSIVVDANAEVAIPVSCVERGRWQTSSRTFSPALNTSHHLLRALISRDVACHYRSIGEAGANQGAVWREVSRKLRAMGSGSLPDMYCAYNGALKEWKKKFLVPKECCGVVFVLQGTIAAADLFDKPDTFLRLWPKLLRSCAIDALEHPVLDPEPTVPEKIIEWLRSAGNAVLEVFPSPGVGLDTRLGGDDVVGSSLLINDRPVHLELFCKKQWTQERVGSDRAFTKRSQSIGHNILCYGHGPRRSLSACTRNFSSRDAKPMKFHSFDAGYLERLRSGDSRTEKHFVDYFGALMRLKLSKRLRSLSEIEEVRQETIARVWAALRNPHGIRQPERLGSFVNSVCNNVLLEHYRDAFREVPIEDDVANRVPDPAKSTIDVIAGGQLEQAVRQILNRLSKRDRFLLQEVLLNERDKDQVCRELGVTREYLRVLLCRAKKSFRDYLKSTACAAGELLFRP